MDPTTHFRKLERLYQAAPITRWYGATILIGDGSAEVRLRVRPEFLHAARAVHGSVYFRLLDDAAFFAVNSRVPHVFVLTVSFTVQFTNPISEGEMIATGRIVHQAGRLFVGAAELHDADGRLLAAGSGTFSRSRIALDERVGYQ
jgi:uncharacterized protein (TIGR00369 family)